MALGLRPLGSAALGALLGGSVSGSIGITEPVDVWAQSGNVSGITGGSFAITEPVDGWSFAGTSSVPAALGYLPKVSPFFASDTMVAAGYKTYRYIGGVLTADVAHTTSGIDSLAALSGPTNSYSARVACTLNSDGSYQGIIIWDNGGAITVADELYIPPQTIDLTQAVANSNIAGSIGDALNAARAQGFGKWTLVGTTLSLYGADGVTVVRSFTLDSASVPTTRQ